LICGRNKRFYLIHFIQTGSVIHLAFFPACTRGSFPGVKWLEHEADRIHPSSAKVKNVWSCTSVCLDGMVLTSHQLYLYE
jgi:hypothetical protein